MQKNLLNFPVLKKSLGNMLLLFLLLQIEFIRNTIIIIIIYHLFTDVEKSDNKSCFLVPLIQIVFCFHNLVFVLWLV